MSVYLEPVVWRASTPHIPARIRQQPVTSVKTARHHTIAVHLPPPLTANTTVQLAGSAQSEPTMYVLFIGLKQYTCLWMTFMNI